MGRRRKQRSDEEELDVRSEYNPQLTDATSISRDKQERAPEETSVVCTAPVGSCHLEQ